MPVYNAARYVAAAINSIRGQTYDNFELIAIDDGSADGSLALLQEAAQQDARIRVISRPNTGIVGALNDGVAAARGEFIARMDADDLALPHRFERQLKYLDENPACVAVGSAMLLMDSEADPVCIQHWAETHEEIDKLLLTGHGGLAHPTSVIRRAALTHVGGYRREYEWIEDKDLWLRLAEVGRLANLGEPLLRYRLHEASVCLRRESEQWRLWEQLLKEVYQRRRLHGVPATFTARIGKTASFGRNREKWIRAAARAGNYRTAAKHTRILLRQRPFRPSTWTTILRAAASIRIQGITGSARR